ncbi:hypothetical protein F4V91_08695 [Neorhizobium galegae]|uniref:Uncharacterized protein n=1 Tax=Neorhizobium galegae TaxID=399 RepID=A0A6A1U314_NEOGA|nr:hypothetical protein F4V91_08695 [Neorhizobium galegae]
MLRRAGSHVRAWLIPDAGSVIKRAWSLRLIELAAVADIILNFVPFIADFIPWWATLALLGGAWIARHVAQPKEKPNANE